MDPRDSNPEEVRSGAGRGVSPTDHDPLGLAEIPEGLENAIKAYLHDDEGLTLSGFPQLRAYILDFAERPSDDEIRSWLDRQESLIKEAMPLMEKATEILGEAVKNMAPFPEWVESEWFAVLRNPWAEDFAVALMEAQSVLG